MNYTITKNEAVNKKITHDLDYIAGKVAALLGDKLHSILLCGGFGRGEGSVVVNGEKIHIVNDYDFTVVLNSKNRFHYLKLYREIHGPLENLAVELAEELEIKQVDLSPKPLGYFTSQRQLKIENYEVKMGHVLTFGDDNPTRHMPDWKVTDIPLFEGTWLFRNRGTGLLLAALYFLGKDKILEEKRENFVIECTKAQLAMGDSILLLKNNYHHLYHKRFSLLESSDISDIPEAEEIKKMYQEGLEQKLRPDFNNYRKRNLKQWWFDVRNNFEIFFKYYEQERLALQFSNWLEYSELAKPEDGLEIKTLAAKFIKLGKSGLSFENAAETYRKSKKSFTISLVALILFSIHEDSFDTQMISAAAKILNVKLSGNSKEDWLNLAQAVLNEVHPGGEVGKVLEEIN